MGGQVIAVRVGDVELLVEASRPAGTENTGVGRSQQRVIDAFERAQDAIIAVSLKAAGTVQRLAAQGARPDKVEIEFGLKFTAKGDVIVASGSSEVALKVIVGYAPARRTVPASRPGEDEAQEEAQEEDGAGE